VPKDRPLLSAWLRDPVVRDAVEDETVSTSRLAETLRHFESSDPFRNGSLCLVMERDDRPVGMIHFAWINWVSRNAEVIVFIGPRELRGTLAGYKCLRLIGDVAFRVLNLHKIYAFVYGSNEGSLGVLRRLLKTEACLKAYQKTGRRYEDLVTLGMLASEYERAVERIGR
jgi:RimJ/RimL family protein N-acetyltransferase